MEDGRGDFAAIACLTWFAGLRIHECFRIDTAMAGQALRENAVTIKGKGGKIRTVPINAAVRVELEQLLAVTPWGHKLFVPDGVPTHHAIAQLQQYIYKVRSQVQDADSGRPMTHHGLRHSYAARTWQELVDGGVSPLNASSRVSQLLGHERPEVTQVYLPSWGEGGCLMNKEIQQLYAKLPLEDRRKVDARIHELFVKRMEGKPNPQQDKSCL